MQSATLRFSPENPASEDFYFQLWDLVEQGRPLTVDEHEDHAVIRAATWGEMLKHVTHGRKHWHKEQERITAVFERAIQARAHQTPEVNQKSWVMQGAWLWNNRVVRHVKDSKSKYASFYKSFAAAQLGLNTEQYDRLPESFRKHVSTFRIQQYYALYDHQIKFDDKGQLLVPWQDGDLRTYRPWSEVEALLVAHPIFERELGSHRLGPLGYTEGAWGNGHYGNEKDWEWIPYDKIDNWDQGEVFEFCFWVTNRGPVFMGDHFYFHLIDDEGNVYSAGRYRPPHWRIKTGAGCFRARMETPDSSTMWWPERNYRLQRFRFRLGDGLTADKIKDRLKQIVNRNRMPYRAPDLICQQDYPLLTGFNFDFSMGMGEVFWRDGITSMFLKVASFLPGGVKGRFARHKNKTTHWHRNGPIIDGLRRIASVLESPFVLLASSRRGIGTMDESCQDWDEEAKAGDWIGDDDPNLCDPPPEPHVRKPKSIKDVPGFVASWFRPRRVEHPWVAYRKFLRVVEKDSGQKHDNDRVYDWSLLEKLGKRVPQTT